MPRRLALAGVAAILAAMLARMGWADPLAVPGVAGAVLGLRPGGIGVLSRRSVLVGTAVVLAAMLGRAGWVHWGSVVLVGAMLVGVLVFVTLIGGLFVALPLYLIWAVGGATVRFLASDGRKPPPQQGSPAPAPSPSGRGSG